MLSISMSADAVSFIRKVFCTLISSGCISLVFRHESTDKRRKLVNTAFVFNGIVTGNFYLCICGHKSYAFPYFDAHHAELKAASPDYALMIRLTMRL